MHQPTIRVFPAGNFAESAADDLAVRINRLSSQCKLWIGISGGETPRPVYTRLAAIMQATPRSDQAHTWFQVDERCVRSDAHDSNQRMIRETLFKSGDEQLWGSFVSVPHPDDPARAAEDYNRSLAPAFTQVPNHRRLLLILGLGTDGHTASLFPNTSWKTTPVGVWYTALQVPHLKTQRLSLTYGAIMQADEIVFLVSGASKQRILESLIRGTDSGVPGGAVMANHPSVTVLADDEAAALLK